MPRPNKPRTIGAEDNMRRNILQWLNENDRSVAWLERQSGLTKGALHKSLHGGRSFMVDESLGLAAACGVPLSELVRESS